MVKARIDDASHCSRLSFIIRLFQRKYCLLDCASNNREDQEKKLLNIWRKPEMPF